LLNYYNTKIKKDQLSELKLADIISIKNILREKIIKEIKGFRKFLSQYQELEKINPQDIQIIMKDIKLSLEKWIKIH